jgi:integrase
MKARNGTRTKHNNLASWEHPEGSRIKVEEILNRTRGNDYNGSYRVCIPRKVSGAKRFFRQFRTKDEAFAFAEGEYTGKEEQGKRYFALTAGQREDALQALSVLKGSGINLTEAARCAEKHLRPKGGIITVESLIKDLLAEKERLQLRERSVRDLRSRLNVFAEAFGERLVHDIEQDEIKRWLNGLARLSVRSQINYRLAVFTLFAHAVENKKRPENPVKGIKPPRKDEKPPCILTIEQAEKLIKTAHETHYSMPDGKPGLGLLSCIALGMFAGLRSSETAQLNWKHIDLAQKRVTVPPDIAKKRKQRYVELSDNCIEWLNLAEPKRGSIAPPGYQKRRARLSKAAGFLDWREKLSNASRHSFGSYHFALHENSPKTAAQLGHRGNDANLFDHYRNLAKKEDAQAYFGLSPQSLGYKVVPFPEVKHG